MGTTAIVLLILAAVAVFVVLAVRRSRTRRADRIPTARPVAPRPVEAAPSVERDYGLRRSRALDAAASRDAAARVSAASRPDGPPRRRADDDDGDTAEVPTFHPAGQHPGFYDDGAPVPADVTADDPTRPDTRHDWYSPPPSAPSPWTVDATGYEGGAHRADPIPPPSPAGSTSWPSYDPPPSSPSPAPASDPAPSSPAPAPPAPAPTYDSSPPASSPPSSSPSD
jgi:hypothetical protein